MNGTWESTDDAVTAGDGRGVIDHVQFEWGDGNFSARVSASADEQNVSHSYERAGTYTVVLNVTDVIGHWKNTTMLVKVNDTDAPSVSLVIRNETYGTTLVENNTLTLDANGTYDNVDLLADLSFSWNFGDGEWYNATGAEGAWNVTHNYSRTGQITVKLNVTDLSNNSKVESRLITVNSGPRPKMNIDVISYDPETSFTEGSAGWILVNLTNTGSANATNIVVNFYIVRADGTQKLIGTETDVYLNDTLKDLVEVGQTVQVRFAYTPDSKGTFTIRVNVTCDDQLRLVSKNAPTLTVEQAAWKTYALWGGVAAVIILVPLLLYLRGRWAKREKKGPRREKKEKEKSSEEEL
jgi:PKD repeat protein